MKKSITQALRCLGENCNKECRFYTEFSIQPMTYPHCKRRVIENTAADIIEAAFFSIKMTQINKKDGEDIVRFIIENFDSEGAEP